jgi:hypothetical protein
MSRLTEIQNQYQSYIAACEVAKKSHPGDVEVVYKNGFNGGSDDGIFIYRPHENHIVIYPRRCVISEKCAIYASDVPALIKALRDFFE